MKGFCDIRSCCNVSKIVIYYRYGKKEIAATIRTSDGLYLHKAEVSITM